MFYYFFRTLIPLPLFVLWKWRRRALPEEDIEELANEFEQEAIVLSVGTSIRWLQFCLLAGPGIPYVDCNEHTCLFNDYLRDF